MRAGGTDPRKLDEKSSLPRNSPSTLRTITGLLALIKAHRGSDGPFHPPLLRSAPPPRSVTDSSETPQWFTPRAPFDRSKIARTARKFLNHRALIRRVSRESDPKGELVWSRHLSCRVSRKDKGKKGRETRRYALSPRVFVVAILDRSTGESAYLPLFPVGSSGK